MGPMTLNWVRRLAPSPVCGEQTRDVGAERDLLDGGSVPPPPVPFRGACAGFAGVPSLLPLTTRRPSG
jgi:hypothetical protein